MEHMSVNRKEHTTTYNMGGVGLKVTVNYHPHVTAPKVSMGKPAKDMDFYNFNVIVLSCGNVIVSFKSKEPKPNVYRIDSTEVIFGSDETTADQMALPPWVVKIEILVGDSAKNSYDPIINSIPARNETDENNNYVAFVPKYNTIYKF